MKEHGLPTPNQIGRLYDQQAQQYKEFADSSFTWNFIEKPAVQRYLKDRVRDDTVALDIGVGTGRVVDTLMEFGVREENITGIDVSQELLVSTQKRFPHMNLIRASVTELPIISEQYDVVTANMVFQYLDNRMLTDAINEIYRVLKPGGLLCFIEPHPLHNDDAIKGENNNQWLPQRTPWGSEILTFNRDPWDLMDILELGGFNWLDGYETLKVESEDSISQNKHHSRAGYLWWKVDEATKALRNDKNYVIPSITNPNK